MGETKEDRKGIRETAHVARWCNHRRRPGRATVVVARLVIDRARGAEEAQSVPHSLSDRRKEEGSGALGLGTVAGGRSAAPCFRCRER